MTKREIQHLIRETARVTVGETLRGLGVDVDNPLEVQRDFQALHEWRVSMQKIRRKALLSAVGVVVAGVLAAIWVGVKSLVSN